MMKFFRKYTKHLLAIFMSLLLVVWLGGSALTNMLESRYTGVEEVVGEAFGEPVQLEDIRLAFNDAQILSAFYVNWKYPWALMLGDLGIDDQRLLFSYASQIRTEPITEYEWYMLTTAAKKCGIYIPAESISEFKDKLGLPPAIVDQIRNRQQWSLEQIDRAMQSFIGVQELAQQACKAVKITEADIQHFVRHTKEQLRVTILAVEGSKLKEADYEPSEQELKEHFDKYKNVASQPAGGVSFGYQLPEAVQLEYIRISADALAEYQTIKDREAYEHWKEHKTEFLRPTTPPATSTAPATQPKPEAPKPYETFTEAKPEVMKKLREEKAQQEVVRIARDLITQLNRPWTESPRTQPGNYKMIPENEKSAEIYPQIIEKNEERYSGVFKYGRTHLIDRGSLSSNPELRRATALGGTRQRIPLVDAAFYVAGLESAPEANKEYTRFFRNLYETCAEPFIDADGNAYVFRTVATRPNQAPGAMEALREQLVEDIRKQRAFDQAGKIAKEIAERVGSDSLEEVFNSDPELKTKLSDKDLYKPTPFTRKRFYSFGMGPQLYPSSIPQMGYDPELVDACFSLVDKATTTQPAPVTAHEQGQKERWLVIQYQGTLPVTQVEYDQQKPVALDYLESQRRIEVLTDWFNPERIRARVGWEEAKPPADEDGESPEESGEDQEA